MRDLKVLVISPGPHVQGGITTVVKRYEDSFLWEHYSCSYLATYDGRNAARKIIAYAKALLIFPLMIRGKDIAHIHLSQIISFRRKTLLFVFCKLFRKKTIIHLHAPYPEEFEGGQLRSLARFVFKRADVIIALSPIWADVVKNISGRTDVRIINNPGLECHKKSSDEKNEQVIAFIGKLEERKGYADLLHAMGKVLKAIPDAKLVFAGHGDIEIAKALAGKLRILDSVEFLGWVGQKDVSALLYRASVFCLPSYGEGVPMAMLEAMSCRVPVVVTPVGGIPDVIINNVNGKIVHPGNCIEIAESIIQLLQDVQHADELSAAAARLIEEKFSTKKICQEIASIYDELS